MEFVWDYITPDQNHSYCCICQALPGDLLGTPEDECHEYFQFSVTYIRCGGGLAASVFEARHAVAWPEFFASPEAAISEVFSGMPCLLPQELVDKAASRVCSYARLATKTPGFFTAGPAPRVLLLEITVVGHRRFGGWFQAFNEPLYGDGDGDWDRNDDEDEVGRVARESAEEVWMFPASSAAIEALEEVKIESISGRVRARKDCCCGHKCAVCAK